MRVSEELQDTVHAAINEGLSFGIAAPKRFLTEHDVQSWIFRALVERLAVLEDTAELAVHCQTRFLDKRHDQEGKLTIEPDLAIFNVDEYTIDKEGGLYLRKAYTFTGSAFLIEIKLCRGISNLDVAKAKKDIRKLAKIFEIHYRDDPDHGYFPIFVLFSRSPIRDLDRRAIDRYAEAKFVKTIIASANNLGQQ